MLLDAGNLFISESKTGCDQKELGKADQILKSYQSMAYDAVNLSKKDLVFGTSFLLEEARALELPFISSNLVSRETGKPVFSPFIIKKAGQINVGIFGLMEHSPLTRKTDSTYIVKNPYDAAREMISSLKDKVGLIIALSSLSKEKNLKLVEELPDIDFVISTNKRTHSPIRVKDGHILSSGDKGKYLGRLDIRLSSLNRPLGLKDSSRQGKLRLNLTWLEQRITKLKQKKEDVLKSDNTSIKERFGRELERLKNQEDKYRIELAELDKADNNFKYSIIPLGSKEAEKATMLTRKARGKSRPKGRTVAMSPGPHIKISTLKTNKGEKITFVLLIDKAPNQVRALGFDVVYNPKVMKYSGYTKRELVNKFDMFDARMLKDGLLRVGGFEARNDLIQKGKSGELMRLDFQVIGKGNIGFQLVRQKDDIASWGVEDVQFSSEKHKQDKGELNNIQKSIKVKDAKWEAENTSVSDLSPKEREKSQVL